ncbi:MAG: hypothetical protein OXH08_12455 [Gammaproteobacteria bacterium]|nr:hypothetical protein [Gammaproteobacteria bacterium]
MTSRPFELLTTVSTEVGGGLNGRPGSLAHEVAHHVGEHHNGGTLNSYNAGDICFDYWERTVRHTLTLGLALLALSCGDRFGESMTPLPQEGPDTMPTTIPLERQGAAARMADDVRYPLVNAALTHVMEGGEFAGVAQHPKVRIDASRIFGGNYSDEPIHIDGRDYARFAAGDNSMSIRDDEYILFIRGLHMDAIGRYRVSVGIGYMHPEYGWGGVLYEMHLSETDNGWQIDTMTAKLHT